jgi:methionyl-tRNA formyltransferase
MKLVFAGTPDFAAAALAALIAAGHEIVLVMTQPDRPSGRGLQVHPSPVKALALRHDLPVAQPRGLRIGGRYDDDAKAAHTTLATTHHDAMVVAAYGLILPADVLGMPPLGCINIHASLLPRWRGAAPIQRAIEAGDAETGITLMQMDVGLDTGPILAMERIAIADDDTGATLTDKLAALGARMVVEALPAIAAGALPPRPQHAPGDESAVTYATKLAKSESSIDFARPTRELVDRIRAFDPWPGCNAEWHDAETGRSSTYRIWRAVAVPAQPAQALPGSLLLPIDGAVPGGPIDTGALIVATGDGAIAITEMQKPGGKRQAARHFGHAFRPTAGSRFVTAHPAAL